MLALQPVLAAGFMIQRGPGLRHLLGVELIVSVIFFVVVVALLIAFFRGSFEALAGTIAGLRDYSGESRERAERDKERTREEVPPDVLSKPDARSTSSHILRAVQRKSRFAPKPPAPPPPQGMVRCDKCGSVGRAESVGDEDFCAECGWVVKVSPADEG